MSTVTIVVPVYNTAAVLRKCLDSIKNQTYKDWTCIVVDDGSTDESGEICDLYAKSDNRFIVHHIKNCGAGEAKNFGIGLAKTEFIAFVDSDDWIDEGYIEFLISKIKPDIDMVMCHAVFEYDEGSVEVLKVSPDEIVCDKSNKKSYILSSINRGYAKHKLKQEQGFLNTVWGKLYRLSVLKQHNILFTGLKLNEDSIFNLYFYYYASGFRIYNNILYHYRMRNSSAVHTFRKDYVNVYDEYLRRVDNYIEKFFNNDSECISSYNSLVITSLFNTTKDYFYNARYPNKKSRKKEMMDLISRAPYSDALKNMDIGLIKNIEVLIVGLAYKYKVFLVLDLYFFIRLGLKDVFIRWKKCNEKK